MASTHLITFTFRIDKEESVQFIETIRELRTLWETNHIKTMLFRDSGEPDKLMLLLITEEDVNLVTRMIQDEPGTRAVFHKIRDTHSRVLVSYMEQVV